MNNSHDEDWMDKHWMKIELTAYRILLKYSDGTLPISPIKISQSMGIRVIDRQYVGDLFDLIGDGLNEKINAPAFSISCGDVRWIALDKNFMTPDWRRLLVAHELAHFSLGHFDIPFTDGVGGFRCVDDILWCGLSRGWVEISCDMFAAWLLAPQTVLAHFGVTSAPKIARLCGIPATMAHLVAQSITYLVSPSAPELSMVCDMFSSAFLDLGTEEFLQNPAEFTSDISEEFI